MMEYSNRVKKLGLTLFELLSEALGLKPSCPQPELTLGASGHWDTSFLTVLLQDQVGGLRVFHENQWLDITPVPGALIINVGDMMQLIRNDKFVSSRQSSGSKSRSASFGSMLFQARSSSWDFQGLWTNKGVVERRKLSNL
ncbi:hypothetical protein HN51_071601 [Arachis hypogaea]|nr:1-aminocyclopropane-1-carboxylate oxidase homolog 4-like [Arachis hypogaea]XP_029149098.1 1-aminocyclopropane-1-carboxylate oxidase homolog 4-like [Arachis hypogaea]QHO14213.1 uncharacterized protein DS421_15g522260 [Arachis hypogaea]